jgi:D-aminopeptidase
MRLRDLGLSVGAYETGPANSITDVPGVRVGHSTVIHGDGPLIIGTGPARTGVTVVTTGREGDAWVSPLYAGSSTLNGTGEWTGLAHINETGHLLGPVFMTNSHSVGTVRDAVIRRESRARNDQFPCLPVVGETFDGTLNDIAGLHVRPEHVDEALDTAGTHVAEGGVGGGTGMIAFGFKSGIGTSSRVVDIAGEQFTVGVIVQSNHSSRAQLVVGGVPVGQLIGPDVVPLPGESFDREERSKNSLLVVLATDAPLLPHQLNRIARRATLGVAVTGGTAHVMSGEFALAFSTANASAFGTVFDDAHITSSLSAVSEYGLIPLFDTAVEATAEAILNALVAAETMTGRDGNTAHALTAPLLLDAIETHHREALQRVQR